jgi:hypothetical protein
MPNVTETTYEIKFSDRQPTMRITIPSTWKVTFGAIVPGKTVSAYGLRIWEGTDKQRAVFANVESFRDLSIPTLIAAVRKYGQEEWFRDNGDWTGELADQVEKAWKPEDEVSSTAILPELTGYQETKAMKA